MAIARGAWVGLAVALEISRKTLIQWRKRPNAPNSANIPEWKAYVKAEGLGISGNQKGDKREELLAASVEKRNKLLDLEIAKEEGKMVDRGDAEALLLHVASLQKTILYAALVRELPAKAAGRPAAEIATIGQEIADRLCEVFAGPIESWRST